MLTRKQAVEFLGNNPVKFAHMLGFNKLTDLHNDWIIDMVKGKEDETLKAHRGSYKTTCVSFALFEIIVLLPKLRTAFFRKTDTDVKEVVKQAAKILQDPHTQYLLECIYGTQIKLTTQSATEINTNLATDVKGTNQLVGMGIGASLTGKHFDRIFTDDIINLNDRISKAEREHTKLVYQELQNIKNRDGRFFNTLTTWHKEDASILMPNVKTYDCYSTGLMSEDEIAKIKESMTPSLFAANYELKIIADEDVIFEEREVGASESFIYDCSCHIDAAYDGSDYTAFSSMNYVDGTFYLYGRTWRKHIEDCYDDILEDYHRLRLGKCFIEKNADKGFVARDLKTKGMRTVSYHEAMNKHVKITTYLKGIWKNVIFVEGTDPEYIEMILDYNENADHDDCPDSASCMARRLYSSAKKKGYVSILEMPEYELKGEI